MLAIVIHLLKALQRALRRGGRHLSFLADVFEEAMADRRAAGRKYPFLD